MGRCGVEGDDILKPMTAANTGKKVGGQRLGEVRGGEDLFYLQHEATFFDALLIFPLDGFSAPFVLVFSASVTPFFYSSLSPSFRTCPSPQTSLSVG